MPPASNPFDGILSPQPQRARQQVDPFADEDFEESGFDQEPDLLATDGGHYSAGGSRNVVSGSSLPAGRGTEVEGQHGYALDPFFDE